MIVYFASTKPANYLIWCLSMLVLILHDSLLITLCTVLARVQVKCSENAWLQQYVEEFKDIFSSDVMILYCQVLWKIHKSGSTIRSYVASV